MEIRSFLAFELPKDIMIIVEKVSGQLKNTSLSVKWVNPKNIHLTVVFMGNIGEDDLPEIEKSIGMVCSRYDSFEISLNGIGVFPNIRQPRVIWLGLDGDMERMSFFRDALQKRLNPFGVKQEKRKFRPHLTLGRHRKSREKSFSGLFKDILDNNEEVLSPTVHLTELVLFKSDLKPTGAEYTKLDSWLLSGKK